MVGSLRFVRSGRGAPTGVLISLPAFASIAVSISNSSFFGTRDIPRDI
jgi:hypothetical protein